MKFLVLIAVLLIAFWLWRSAREAGRADPPPGSNAPRPEPPRLEMVRCATCGLHLPEADAVRANAAYYCSVDHLNQATERQT